MSTAHFGQPPSRAKAMVAVMAAIQAFLDEERSKDVAAARPLSAWRLAAWQLVNASQIRPMLPWRGRD